MGGASDLDRLVTALSADLRPVRRLRPPPLRAALWLSVVAALAGALAATSDLAALAARLSGARDMGLALAGSSLTAVLAAVAAFELSVPGRGRGWALLPLPALALWIGASGMGCLRGYPLPGAEPAGNGMGECLPTILLLSVPLTALMAVMLRRGFPERPGLAATLSGLAVAAASASLLAFRHPYDAAVLDLLAHALAVAIVIGANLLISRHLAAGGRA